MSRLVHDAHRMAPASSRMFTPAIAVATGIWLTRILQYLRQNIPGVRTILVTGPTTVLYTVVTERKRPFEVVAA
jgi:uncharacterized membrane protein YcaP (DUF421 family)